MTVDTPRSAMIRRRRAIRRSPKSKHACLVPSSLCKSWGTVMQDSNDEENRLRSVALQNARSIFIARQRTEEAKAQAQEQLREAASRLQLALAAGQLGDWSWDASADLVTLGPRAAEIFGLPPGKLVTRARIRESLHEDDVERARQTIERALAYPSVYSAAYRVKHPVRGLRWAAA